MRSAGRTIIATAITAFVWTAPAQAQEPEQSAAQVPCRDQPCAVVVDWDRAGGVTSLTPDRRYGNPGEFEARLKQQLAGGGFVRHASTDAGVLRIVLIPQIRNTMCDQIAGTATDMSCRAITEIQARLEGPDEVREDIDLPSRIRNRCGSDQLMPADKLATFVAETIIYALDGKAKGERRPVGRC